MAADPEPRPYHHGDLRRALVEAADRILEREGPGALSLRAVAREAGVSPAAPYHHFKDKDELMGAVARQGFDALAETMSEASDKASPENKLNALGVAYVCFARDHPALYHVMYNSSRKRDFRSKEVPREESGAYRMVREAMMRSKAAITADPLDLELAAVAGWCAAHGLAEMAHAREFDDLKAQLGGDEPFFSAVLSHLRTLKKPLSGFAARFAPSPTGLLHKGHAYSALSAHQAAQRAGGRFLLRIEDIDTERCRPEFEQAILEDLTWLGLSWETPVRRQSEHLADYRVALETLRGRGLVYRCFRTRKEVLDEIARAPHGPAEAFRGGPLAPDEEAERMARGESFAWRLSLDAARAALGADWDDLAFVEEGAGLIPARPETAGDVVLARKDLGVAYHLAVVVDDALQAVSHVVRGEDLFEATHIQRLLQTLLGLPTPVYRHHRLLVGPDGKRFAKRDKAQTLAELRAAGVTAQALRTELGF